MQPKAVYQWTAVVEQRFPHLSKPHATVVALWSLGLVLARGCALTAVTAVLAALLGRRPTSVRQQVREFCSEAAAKRGAQRREVVVARCTVPLVAWTLDGYQGQHLALAIDATTLGERFVVLAVSVVYRGGAIPVSWTVLRAGEPHAWRQEWPRMLRQLRPAIPRHLTVIVLADRGLYARWLFRRIVRLGWHPFPRVNLGGAFRPAGQDAPRPLRSFVPRPGTAWAGCGSAFRGRRRQVACTLLARWEVGYRDPWLILTDLPPAAADAGWYGLRAWIEQSFKLTKRGGFQWQRTRMTDPARAARLWLAVAVATLWLVRVGSAVEDAIPDGALLDLAPALAAQRRQRRATRMRLVSLFRLGCATILAALLHQAPLPQGVFRPDPWPVSPPLATTTA